MFGSGFKIRVTGLQEEEDYMAVDRWINDRLEKTGGQSVSKEEYERACREAPRKIHLVAHCVIFNGEGQRVGSMDLNVTDRRNVVFVGLEVSFEWI